MSPSARRRSAAVTRTTDSAIPFHAGRSVPSGATTSSWRGRSSPSSGCESAAAYSRSTVTAQPCHAVAVLLPHDHPDRRSGLDRDPRLDGLADDLAPQLLGGVLLRHPAERAPRGPQRGAGLGRGL